MSNYDEYPVPAIAELLEELCPRGVRSHRLDKIFLFAGGYTPSKKDPANWDRGNIPWFRVEDIHINGRVLEDSLQHATNNGVKSSGLFPAGSLIVSTSATIGEYALITTDFLCNQRFHVLTPRSEFADQIHDRYLLYVGAVIGDFCKRNVEIGGFNNVKMPALKAFEIPLPPLEVQEQIVAILDTFTDLDASLMRELELRNDQFNHALDSVFGNSQAPRSPLGKLGDFTKGKGVTKSQLQDEGLPTFHYGQVHTYYGYSATSTISCVDPDLIKNPTLAHPGDLVLATTSEDNEAVGKAVAWLGDEDAVVGGDAHVYSHSLEPRYASYFFASHDFQLQKGSKVYGTKVRRINDKGLSALTIPVPAPEVQGQIADTLDMFTEYMANLRREIELRHQQLEYYREQLLTFPVAE